jgi:hypothetical protein
LPRFFSEFFDESVLLNLISVDSFYEAEFALVVKEERAGVEFKDDAGLFVWELVDEIIARMAGGEAFFTIVNQLAGHTKMNHQGFTVIKVDDESLAEAANGFYGAGNGGTNKRFSTQNRGLRKLLLNDKLT